MGLVGWIHRCGSRGRVRLERYEVLGMEVFAVCLPGREGGLLERRRLRRGLELLEQRGCRKLLAPCPAAPALCVVHTRSLWQAMAGPLALSSLDAQGVAPDERVVAIHADRLSRPLLRCCQYLAPRVRALALSPEAQSLLGWRLERCFGLPAVERRAQVSLSFLPGQGGPYRFMLGEEDPVIQGCRLALPGLEPPPGCPDTALLAALLDEGRLPLSQVEVRPGGA